MSQEIESCLNFKTLHLEGVCLRRHFMQPSLLKNQNKTKKARVYIYIWIRLCRFRENNMDIMTKERNKTESKIHSKIRQNSTKTKLRNTTKNNSSNPSS